MTHFLLSLGCI